jgi:hypothetical protein
MLEEEMEQALPLADADGEQQVGMDLLETVFSRTSWAIP